MPKQQSPAVLPHLTLKCLLSGLDQSDHDRKKVRVQVYG